MKKYEFTGEIKLHLGKMLHRIRACVSFGDIAKGEIGGWIEKEENLSHYGDAWVYGDACVSGNACVYGDARVSGDAWVYGDARVSGNACVYGNNRLLTIGNIGSREDTTTFCYARGGIIQVACGCFRGTIEAFAEKVKEIHGDNKYGKQYALAIELAKLTICTDKAEGEDG